MYNKCRKRQATNLVLQEKRPKSLYDILCNRMKLLNRKFFIHRIFYIGECQIEINASTNIRLYLKDIIAGINSGHCEERLTGFVLSFSKYFLNVVEGSESELIEHLNLLRDAGSICFGRVKLLVVQHNIKERLLKNWVSVTPNPWNSADRMQTDFKSSDDESIIKIIKAARRLGGKLDTLNLVDGGRTIIDIDDNVDLELLVDDKLIDVLLDDRKLFDIEDYHRSYGNVPEFEDFIDISWPVAPDYVPRNILRESLVTKYLTEKDVTEE
ncbi:PREDICTED: uncharacterized protein C7orf62 homolog [Nicrophorus vespilloides]|uniref:Uncharacterized protein C7orf62 homolog n=1 Tax=Nicrophorus vespilloides TaxID=110193 RepID=A0ABM1N5F7_NICVS|nr:PREDICTED: uncharacterized protein C7orf62 homolog [Nicrophorus vespilloides]